ncbi:MAG: signal peptidase I [Coriobacteriia bacterium]|nr:signal peptidase I [Coriobacteriia bacterium]
MTDSQSVAPKAEEQSMGRWLLETALLVALAFALAFGIRSLLVEPFIVPTGSMIPTIEIGNRVLAEKITYRFVRPPRYGDIVVFPDPKGEHPHLIKRVIATGGQVVDLRNGKVFVNGTELVEPYTHGQPSVPLTAEFKFPYTVPAGDLWVMGDNRTNSGDSRVFGPISAKAVEGHAVWTYWPLSAFGGLN